MTTNQTNAHERLLARMHEALARFLSTTLVKGTDAPRQHHRTRERYLAVKIPRKILGIFTTHDEEKIFAAYPWEEGVGSVVCYLLADRTGLLEEVKRVVHAFHEDTKVHVILSFVVRGETLITCVYPLKPISMPPPPAPRSPASVDLLARQRHAAKKFSR